jgi:signal transduction histidine kinase
VAATDEEAGASCSTLHDGAQQRLVHTVITLKLAQRALKADADTAPALVTEALDQAERATVELRELAHEAAAVARGAAPQTSAPMISVPAR